MKTLEQHSRIIRKYNKPYTYYFLCTVIPWAFWFLSGYLSHLDPFTKTLEWATGITGFLGLMAPVIISLAVIWPDKAMRADFLGRFFNFKSIKPEYIFLACFLMLSSILLAQAISLLFGYSAEQFAFSDSFSFTSSLFPVWFLLIAAPVLEELAWHSYGTDTLMTRFNLFTTSILFATYWAVWHFPLSTIKGYYHSNLEVSGLLYSLNFILSLLPFVIIMNWIYYKSRRNIILTIVFHITAGLFNEIFATHPMSKVIQTGLLAMLAIYLVERDKELFFSKIKKASSGQFISA